MRTFLALYILMTLGCATQKQSSDNFQAAFRAPSSDLKQRCFVGSRISGPGVSKGVTFDDSSWITGQWPDAESQPSNEEIAKKWVDSGFDLWPGGRKIRLLQKNGVCPPPEDPNPAICLVELSKNLLEKSADYIHSGKVSYRIKIQDVDGVRTIVIVNSLEAARTFATRLREIGQCERILPQSFDIN